MPLQEVASLQRLRPVEKREYAPKRNFPNDLVAETLKVGEKFPFTERWERN
jgi:hypothetical protein